MNLEARRESALAVVSLHESRQGNCRQRLGGISHSPDLTNEFEAISVQHSEIAHDDGWSEFRQFPESLIHTELESTKVDARSIKERLANIISYCTHRITNGVAEGMNSKIMSIKRRVRGF